MENVVPVSLQRLRAADIIRMAGLTAASLGQEYCRSGAVHGMFRRGALLVGIVELRTGAVGTGLTPVRVPTEGTDVGEDLPLYVQANDDIFSKAGTRRFPVEVELIGAGLASTWQYKCSCSTQGQEGGSGTVDVETGANPRPTAPAQPVLCAHGAALLYQWLAQPLLFQTQDSAPPVGKRAVGVGLTSTPTPSPQMQAKSETVGVKSTDKHEESNAPSYLQTLLSQASLSELRAVAREYGLGVSGTSRQQLAESVQAELKKPDAVRRIATTLEKSQRQLLAALILAGGAMSDDDLRRLFERFSLGQPGQLQQTLLTLQSKALLLRISLNDSNIIQRPQHGVLRSTLMDIGWYVPLEVRNALRVSVPITPFNVHDEQGAPVGQVRLLHQAETAGPLAMLLLVVRLLDGYTPGANETWYERSEQQHPLEAGRSKSSSYAASMSSLPSSDGSVAMPSPEDLPPPSLLQKLQEHIAPRKAQTSSHSAESQPAFLHFILRVLGIADLFQKGEGQTAALRLRSDTIERLLASEWTNTLRQLFKRWLTQTSYGDLYDLNEEGLRLRCRAHVGPSYTGQAHMLHQPVLRASELDAENSQARQYIIALLAQAPLNQWINFTSFARFVYRLNPLFLQRGYMWGSATGYAVPQWWLELEDGRPLRPLQLSDWLRAEFLYLKHLIAGPLHWWGMCDIVTGAGTTRTGTSPSADGDLLAFRLTPMAGWLFNALYPTTERRDRANSLPPIASPNTSNTNEPTPKMSDSAAGQGQLVHMEEKLQEKLQEEDDYQQYVDALEVTDASEILVSCSVQNWPVIQLLELFAEPTGIQPLRYPQTERGDRENPTQPSASPNTANSMMPKIASDLGLAYRLSAKGFGFALGRGLRPFGLLRLLRLAAEAKADANPEQAQLFTQIATQLEQWLMGYSRVRLYTGVTLLETVDVAVMREVVATTSLEEAIVKNIHSTLCIVKPQRIGHIVDELKQRGQSPLLHDEDL